MRKRDNNFGNHNSGVIEDFLEFPCGLRPLMGSQIRQATHVDWVEVQKDRLSWLPEFLHSHVRLKMVLGLIGRFPEPGASNGFAG